RVILSAENAFACESIFGVKGPPHCVSPKWRCEEVWQCRVVQIPFNSKFTSGLNGDPSTPCDLRICEDHLPLRMTSSVWLPLGYIRVLITQIIVGISHDALLIFLIQLAPRFARG